MATTQVQPPRYLDLDPWMTRIPCTPRFELKRVSKARDAHFPRELRQILAHQGAHMLVAHLMKTESLGLAAAWAKVKHMVNEFPSGAANERTDHLDQQG